MKRVQLSFNINKTNVIIRKLEPKYHMVVLLHFSSNRTNLYPLQFELKYVPIFVIFFLQPFRAVTSIFLWFQTAIIVPPYGIFSKHVKRSKISAASYKMSVWSIFFVNSHFGYNTDRIDMDWPICMHKSRKKCVLYNLKLI